MLKAISFTFNSKHEATNLGRYLKNWKRIIFQKVNNFIEQKEEWSEIESKSKGAVNFFFTETRNKIFDPLKNFTPKSKGKRIETIQ